MNESDAHTSNGNQFGPYSPWFDINHPMNAVRPRRYSVEELEHLLNSEEDVAIQILPNGEIVANGTPTDHKPLTMRENLGGEYTGRFAPWDLRRSVFGM